MNGHFPKAKFVQEVSSRKQITHALGEICEVYDALTENEPIQRIDEEMADLLHSCETYFHIRELEGADVAAIFAGVVEKNWARGYYEPKPQRCQTCQNIYCHTSAEYAVECRTNYFSYHQPKGDL